MDKTAEPRVEGSSTVAEAVLSRLRIDIIRGRFEPGQKLLLDRMRELYGAGISPVREALSRLASDGLVVQESQRGFRVRPASWHDLRDITDNRIRLETAAIALSVERGDDDWEARVVSAHHVLAKFDPTRIAEPPLREDWEARHREFHAALIAACGSPWLLHFCALLHDQFDRYRRLAKSAGRRQPQLATHHTVLARAVKARQPEAAAKILAEHIGDTANALAKSVALAGEPKPAKRLRAK